MCTSILQCPIDGSDLVLMDAERLAALKRSIERGEVRHACGTDVKLELEGALVNANGSVAYPVIDGIFVLLPHLALNSKATPTLVSGTAETMAFYDEIGWKENANGSFADAVLFEDLRPVSRDYIHRCHLRVKDHLPPGGKYLLDVASGPVQYPEYLTYSEHYECRVCADISITALRAAKQKLGNRGVYIQCDITQLPLKTDSMDAFVSLHTIYHVPLERQHLAFAHLERVLKPGGSGVVVYSWGMHSKVMEALTADFHPLRMTRRTVRRMIPEFVMELIRGKRQPLPAGGLYFNSHDHGWVRQHAKGWELLVWRSVSVAFMKRYVHGRAGEAFLRRLFDAERANPRFFGRWGQYPLLVCRKS